jgi:AICAR transformylase/IMP cyclohydrolase PurH
MASLPVRDSVGDHLREAHRAGIERIVQTGGSLRA